MDNYRKKIDVIDRNIVKLLLLRLKLVKQIASYKRRNRIRVMDKKRELQVIKNITTHSKLHQKFMINIFKIIMNYSKKIQK